MATGLITQPVRIQGKVLADFMRSREYFQVIRGPLGSAKTTTMIGKSLLLFQNQKPDKEGIRRSRAAFIRATYPELTSILIPDFKKLVRPEMATVVMGHPPMARLDYPLPDGTRVEGEIVFLAVDRADDIRKLRGLQLTFCAFNELRFVVDSSIVTEALSRCNRYPAPGWSPWYGGLADSNAWSQEDWIEEFRLGFLDEKLAEQLGRWAFFVQPPAVIATDGNDPDGYKSITGGFWKVNPEAENLANLTSDYYANQIASNKDDWIRVNLANELGFTLAGKLVHPEYKDNIHAGDENYKPDPALPIYVGMDFGMTAAAIYLQKDLNGTWHAFQELVLEDGGVPTLAECIKFYNSQLAAELRVPETQLVIYYFGDPSGDSRHETNEGTAFQMLRTFGIAALPARTNDMEIRREALDRVLRRQNGFKISPRCRVLRKALASGFVYQKLKVSGIDKHRDKPNKDKWSHPVEAVEYALMSAGEHAVVNREGPRAVLAAQGRPVTMRSDWAVF